MGIPRQDGTQRNISIDRRRVRVRAARLGIARLLCLLCLLAWADAASAAQCRWTGAGPDDKWSSAGNWADCNGARPQNGDDAHFLNGAARAENVNDIPGLRLGTVLITGRGAAQQSWHISGVPLTLTSRLLFASVFYGTDGGVPLFEVPITLGQPLLIANQPIGVGGSSMTARLGDINLNGFALTFDTQSDILVKGVISGNGSLLKIGTWPLTLNDNSYTGTTTIRDGMLEAATSNALGASGVADSTTVEVHGFLSFNDGLVVNENLTFADGTIGVAEDALVTLAGLLVVPNGLSAALDLRGTLTVTGRIIASDGTLLFQYGGGTLTVSNPDNAWPHFMVDRGTLRVGVQGAIPSTGRLNIGGVSADAIFDLNGFDVSIASLEGGEYGRILLGSRTLTINQSVPGTFAGTIEGAGNVVKTGAEALTFDGPNANTYTGTTTVQAGRLALQKPVSVTSIAGPLVVSGGTVAVTVNDEQISNRAPVTVNAPGVLDLAGHKEQIRSLAGDGQVVLGTGTLSLTNSESTTFAGTFNGDRAMGGQSAEAYVRVFFVGGTLTLTGNSTLNDQLVIGAGTLVLDGRLNGAGVQVSGGILAGSGTVLSTNGINTFVSMIVVSESGIVAPGPADGGPGILHGDAMQFRENTRLEVDLNGPAPGTGYDQLDLTSNLALLGADVELVARRSFDPPKGTSFTIVNMAAGKTVDGTFGGLAEGATLDIAGQKFGITYRGGDGNDVVLTALDDPPAPPAITYFLSEGATGQFFDDDVLIANPNGEAALVALTFSKENGEQVNVTRSVPAQSHLTVHVDQIPGLEATAASVLVTSISGKRLMVERSMFWNDSYYGGHTGSAVDKPSADWFFAEGSQGFFDTFVLIINPNVNPVDVTFTFVRENEAPVVKTVTVGAATRLTLHARELPELIDRSFGIAVHATEPIMAERAMYFGTTATRVWSGGSESAGVTAPSKQWFLAEGATGSFFDTFVLLSNPQNTAAQVTLQYLLDTGETVTVPKTIAANARLTTNIEAEDDARLKNAAVSTVVTSDIPVIAERSMYWKGAAEPWGEGHNSFGVVNAGTTWGLAEGRNGTPLKFHTYILLANPQAADANVTVTFLRETGAPVTQTYVVPKTSRFNIDTAAIAGLEEASFGALIKVTNDVAIIVERSMYWDSNGFAFSGGTNATGISLPDDLTPVPVAPIDITGINGAQSFSPNPAIVTPGQAIVWRNSGGGVTHRLVANDGSFDTGNIAGGATSAAVTVKSDNVAYHCSLHPSMTGTIRASTNVLVAAPTCSGASCR
jgi:autotransporter-associated beta strand protein